MMLFESVGKHIKPMMMMFKIMLMVVVVVAGERGRGPWLCESSCQARSFGRERICYNANFPQKNPQIIKFFTYS